MRIRTIDAGYKEYKETIDPNTCVSKFSWRQLVISHKLKSVRQSGNRWLYDLDEMVSYLANPLKKDEDSAEVVSYGTLRKVKG